MVLLIIGVTFGIRLVIFMYYQSNLASLHRFLSIWTSEYVPQGEVYYLCYLKMI